MSQNVQFSNITQIFVINQEYAAFIPYVAKTVNTNFQKQITSALQ